MELLEQAIKILNESNFPVRAAHLDKILRPLRAEDESYPSFPRHLQTALENDNRVEKFNIGAAAYFSLR